MSTRPSIRLILGIKHGLSQRVGIIITHMHMLIRNCRLGLDRMNTRMIRAMLVSMLIIVRRARIRRTHTYTRRDMITLSLCIVI